MRVCRKIIILTFTLFSFISAVHAATIHDFVNHVNSEVEAVNQLAAEKKLSKAVERLNMLNRYIDHKIGFELEDLIREEKKKNPSFQLNLNLKLRPELTKAYWQSRYKRTKKAYQDSVDAQKGLASMRTLDKQDIAWSYMKTTYDAVKSVKDVVESIGTQDYVGIIKNTKEGMDGFIKNYKQVEEKQLQSLETDLKEVEMKGLARRAEKTIKIIEPVLSYMKANAEEGERFDDLLKKVKKIKSDVDGGKVKKMVFGDSSYTWNYEPFLKEIKEAVSDLKEGYMLCPAFDAHVKQVRIEARKDWDKVLINIQSSNDKENKPGFLKWHDEAWEDFGLTINPIITKAKEQYCKKSQSGETKQQPPEESGKTEFGGVKKKPEKKKSDPEPEEEEEIEPEKEEEKKEPPPPPPKKVVNKKGAVDRYWENTIPANASTEWTALKNNREIELRYSVQGKTVGFRRYHSLKLERVLGEGSMDGLGTRHGPNRIMDYDYKTGQTWVKMLSFYRNNLRTGPYASFDKDGNITGVSYYIDDKSVSQAEYKNKARGDRSLAPAAIHEDPKWLELPKDSPPAKLKTMARQQEIPWEQFSIPQGSHKFIKANYTKNNNTVTLWEDFYHPDYLKPVAERIWFIKDGVAVLSSETLKRGIREIYRKWDPVSGKLTSFSALGYSKIKNSKSRLGLAYFMGKRYSCPGGRSCSREEYLAARDKEPYFPPLDLIDQYREKPSGLSPDSAGNPPRTMSDISLQQLPPGARLWKITVHSDSLTAQYVLDNRLVAALTWYDHEMTMPRYRTNYVHGKKILYVSWRKSGLLNGFEFHGRVEKGFEGRFDENGKLKKYSYLGQSEKNVQNGKTAYQPFSDIPPEDAWTWPGLKSLNQPVNIPAAEMSPYLTAVLSGKLFGQHSAPAIVKKSDAREETETKEDFQKKQRTELFQLMAKINEKLEAADKAFDEPYWEKQAPKTTMRATNPKQKSLDIVRSAITIADKAEFIENRGALYLLIAHKLINYSGRVFTYTAKQDFFSLAVKLVLKSDETIKKNQFLKEDLSEAYANSGAIWRDLTRKAQWGDHQYNKMYCDKMVIRQYERALSADPNNKKVRKILEQLKAPKKPVPSEVEKFKEIEPEVWNDAQKLSIYMNEDDLVKELTKEPVVNPIQIADITLNAGSGDVYLKRSGSSDWKTVSGDYNVIFVGDELKTGPKAKGVSVTFTSNHAELAIKPDARIEFQDSHVLLIYRAGAYVRVTRKGDKFLVITPTCAVGVRGTSFEVNVGEDKTTETYLFEGVVETRTGNDIGYLVPGQKNTVRKDSAEIVQESFDSQKRFETKWSTLNAQLEEHDRIRRSAASRKPQIASNTSPYGGVSKAKSVNNTFGEVTVSWSPYESYSIVMLNDEFNYGPHNLIARLPIQIKEPVPVSVDWYKDGQKISTGDYQIEPSSNYFDGQIVTSGEPLNPGNYRVEFVSNGKVLSQASVSIRTPEKVSNKAATERYANAIRQLQEALTLVEQGDLFNSGISASKVINDLRIAMYSAPNLPDIQAVNEMALAMMSFTEMIHATNEQRQEQASEWVKRSLGHARRSNQLAKDPQFKTLTAAILTALENVFPDK